MCEIERDILVLGFSDDVRALLDHLCAEAPAVIERIAVIDRRPEVVERLNRAAIAAVCGDPFDAGVLQRAGIDRATMVLRLDPRSPGLSELGPLLRQLCPRARLLVSRSGGKDLSAPGAGHPETVADGLVTPVDPGRPWGHLTTWQFWLLVAVFLVDATIFALPLVSAALLVAALGAPRCLRHVARFLDALAERR
ncbi:MAG: NAD-binding protein [Candidatus Rokubacteria bacterium]|nr:NAD-binding protein [Candidatus Rokubacteria bacterium]